MKEIKRNIFGSWQSDFKAMQHRLAKFDLENPLQVLLKTTSTKTNIFKFDQSILKLCNFLKQTWFARWYLVRKFLNMSYLSCCRRTLHLCFQVIRKCHENLNIGLSLMSSFSFKNKTIKVFLSCKIFLDFFILFHVFGPALYFIS